MENKQKDVHAVLIGALLILLVGIYFIGKIFWTGSDNEDQATQDFGEQDIEASVATITPEVLRKKIINKEPLELIDVRPETLYAREHIPHSLSLTLEALSNFTPNNNAAVIIIFSQADTQTLATVKNILKQRSFPAFFVEGGFENWKAQGEETISIGDPNSFVDQSKVSYIQPVDLKKLLSERDNALLLLDVQTTQNFAKHHIQRAINIPLDQLEKRSTEISIGKSIVVYGENELVSFQGGVRLYDLRFFGAKTLTGNDLFSPQSGLPLAP